MAASHQIKIAGFDLDDTLTNCRPMVLREAKRQYGVKPVQSLLRTKGITKAFPTLNKDQLHHLLSVALDEWKTLQPTSATLPEIFSAVYEKAGFDEIWIVTATHGNRNNARLWLGDHSIVYDRFVGVDSNTGGKLRVPVSVMIDDSFTTGMQFGRAGRPYVWVSHGVKVEKGIRERLLRHHSVIEAERIEQVPEILASSKVQDIIKSETWRLGKL